MEGVHRFLARVWRLGTERLAAAGVEPTPAQAATMNRAVGRVTEDTEAMRFNTAIAAMMEAVNAAYKWEACPRLLFEQLVLMLAPYAPHVAEELWQVRARAGVGCWSLGVGQPAPWAAPCGRQLSWSACDQPGGSVQEVGDCTRQPAHLLPCPACHAQMLGHEGSLAYESWPAFDPSLVQADSLKLPVQVNGKVRAVVEVEREIGRDAALEAARANDAVARHLAGKQVVKVVWVPGRALNLIVK